MTDDNVRPLRPRTDRPTSLKLGGLRQWYDAEAAVRGMTPHALMVHALQAWADEHTPDQAEPPGPLALDAELADVVFNWGDWYAITVHGADRRRYLAQRRDGKHTLTAESAAELRAKIEADNAADPVPREVMP